ncbi:Protein LOL2 [Raphanus sativus]|uniref:Protein LOL2 n=1 Tax=Raphanus sativus TaxID=3726 RepID=A0A6J0KNW9_RAPSA|nr:protein LOL2 [Raphanus sativus]KAJ4880932.1 Protein LOL2 [Raphanus sativus]
MSLVSSPTRVVCERVMIAKAETRGVMEDMQTRKKEEEEEGPPPGWESIVLLPPPPPPISAVTTAENSTTTTSTVEIPEKAQMVCGSCRRLLSYPRGTKHVKCSCCLTLNLVLEAYQVGQVKCSNCELLLMYPYGAPSVRCSSCKSVTDIREDNKRPPWSVQQGPLKTLSSVR